METGRTSGRFAEVGARLLEESRLWSPLEICSRPGPVPRASGVYAFFFEKPPPCVPVRGCLRRGGATLLYLGIAPSRPESRSTLRRRLRSHLRGNASGSTLRLTLGCLLARELDIQLRRVGRTRRFTFSRGEEALSAWLDRNARVAWLEIAEPWRLEAELVRSTSLPLNLALNEAHPFHPHLHAARRDARAAARKLPVLPH